MNKLNLKTPSLAALALCAACGGNVVAESTGTGAGTSTGTATGAGAGVTGTGTGTATGTSGVGGSSSGGPCPASPPTSDSCAGVPAGFRCTYGDSVRPECREAWQCEGGQWLTSNMVCSMSTSCGNTEPPAGTVCMDMGAVCSYGDTICFCGCGGLACMVPVQWQCSPPPTGAGCPQVVPNDGTACTAEGTQCIYGNVCGPSGAQVTCTSGFWLWDTMIACAG